MLEKAIVIDDDELVNESLCELLEIMEINVVDRGVDGKDAVELFVKHMPDYTLVDLNMPNFDGFYAVEQIRKLDTNALVFVITGDTTVESKINLENLGVTGIIYKPFKIEELVDRLRAAKSNAKAGMAA
ncbi:MAG: response regulator [Nitrosopumilaceae archaeon]|jgi:DNA-binding response OmpR family regulator|uniref:Response regulator n=1 Tax=Candidatus Nitrosomaritimum aestuariumsis TaxID=3342354 RepID=A0AC60VZM6_9ARCH|nr:response regulator [Nitrosopumilaceae archaeon]